MLWSLAGSNGFAVLFRLRETLPFCSVRAALILAALRRGGSSAAGAPGVLWALQARVTAEREPSPLQPAPWAAPARVAAPPPLEHVMVWDPSLPRSLPSVQLSQG